MHIFHKWNKWGSIIERKYERSIITSSGKIRVGIVLKRIQTRICATCGKIEERVMTIENMD